MAKQAKLIIPGTLPGLNEYIKAERTNRQIAARMKKRVQHMIGLFARVQLRGVHFTRPVIMHYFWVEPNRKRDKDNIAFAKKFIQDTLVQCKILDNDGWKNIDSFRDSFAVDQKNPRVVVIIEEIE